MFTEKNRIITKLMLAAIVATVVFSTNSVAVSATAQSDFSYRVISYEAKTVCLVLYNGNESNVEIPREINGFAVSQIGAYTFGGKTQLVCVNIPDTVTSVESNAFSGCSSLNCINVADENTFYKSVDGVLYKKDMSVLVKYPPAKSEKLFILPAEVSSIEQDAFANRVIASGIFISDNTKLSVSQNYNISGSGLTVFGSRGSAAEKIAAVNGLAFEASDKAVKISGSKLIALTKDISAEDALKLLIASGKMPKNAVIKSATDSTGNSVAAEMPLENGMTMVISEADKTHTLTVSLVALGDVNTDGKISILDAKLLLKSISGADTLDASAKTFADLNGDGHVSILDAKLLLKEIAQK